MSSPTESSASGKNDIVDVKAAVDGGDDDNINSNSNSNVTEDCGSKDETVDIAGADTTGDGQKKYDGLTVSKRTVEMTTSPAVPPANKTSIDNDDEVNTNAAVTSLSSRPSPDKKNDILQTIPKKKRPRLEDDDDDDNENNADKDEDDDENSMLMDVSLAQLKRQIMGRDLKVDNDEHGWEEDGEDAEIRQIRALMNPSSSSSSSNPAEATVDDSEKSPLSSTADAQNIDEKSSSSSLLSEKLRKDLICAICHEITYPPLGLMCGHTFCQPCISWWFEHDKAGRCPTCRRAVVSSSDRNVDDGFSSRSITLASPNLALKTCIMAMFGFEIVARLQNRKRERKPKGEWDGAHNAGYQIISELRGETWHYVATGTTTSSSCVDVNNAAATATATTIPGRLFVQVRRSIVLDAEDQRMQLALAIYQKPMKQLRAVEHDDDDDDDYNGSSRGCFRVQLCLLTMEEDEAADSGFPTNITTPEDEMLMCGNGCSRFLYSSLDVQMKDDNGGISPLARLSCDANGCFNYILDPTQSAGNPTETRALLFEHSETGTQLEIDLAQLQNRAGGSTLLPNRQPKNRRTRDNDYYNEDGDFGMGRGDESEEEEAENQDEFEEDGFLVGENDESDVEGAFSDGDDDDDRCVICKDGGELMFCDGGEENDGCGQSFHTTCVGRSVIPEGDWICQACAQSAGIEAGSIGHEFPAINETPIVADKQADDGHDTAANDDEDEDDDDNRDDETKEETLQQDIDCEDTPVVKPSGNGNNNNNKRRFVLEDSDSD